MVRGIQDIIEWYDMVLGCLKLWSKHSKIPKCNIFLKRIMTMASFQNPFISSPLPSQSPKRNQRLYLLQHHSFETGRQQRSVHCILWSTGRKMLGMRRSSPLDCLERPPSKLLKDDHLSIYGTLNFSFFLKKFRIYRSIILFLGHFCGGWSV